jgi:hypothetical protein
LFRNWTPPEALPFATPRLALTCLPARKYSVLDVQQSCPR